MKILLKWSQHFYTGVKRYEKIIKRAIQENGCLDAEKCKTGEEGVGDGKEGHMREAKDERGIQTNALHILILKRQGRKNAV